MPHLKKPIIFFEKKYKVYTRSTKSYERMDILLKVSNDEYLDPDDWRKSKKYLPFVSRKYWETLKNLCFDGTTLIVKLSGLHYDPFGGKEFLFSKMNRSNLIVHYHHWKLKNYREEESFCLLECNESIFKELFRRFWFSSACEVSFQGIILKSTRSPDFFRWYLRQKGEDKFEGLLEKAELMFDNLHNGFHFRVNAPNKKYNLNKLFNKLIA